MNILAALGYLSSALANASQLSAVIAAAQAQGRTKLTPEEWQPILANRDAAIATLDADFTTTGPKP